MLMKKQVFISVILLLVSLVNYGANIADNIVSNTEVTSTGKILSDGAKRMAEQDPYGLILSAVAISVVFIALIILWWLLSFLFSKRKLSVSISIKKNTENNEEIASAIAMALSEHLNEDEKVAILLALEQDRLSKKHDYETYVLSIKNTKSVWSEKSQSFRKR